MRLALFCLGSGSEWLSKLYRYIVYRNIIGTYYTLMMVGIGKMYGITLYATTLNGHIEHSHRDSTSKHETQLYVLSVVRVRPKAVCKFVHIVYRYLWNGQSRSLLTIYNIVLVNIHKPGVYIGYVKGITPILINGFNAVMLHKPHVRTHNIHSSVNTFTCNLFLFMDIRSRAVIVIFIQCNSIRNYLFPFLLSSMTRLFQDSRVFLTVVVVEKADKSGIVLSCLSFTLNAINTFEHD